MSDLSTTTAVILAGGLGKRLRTVVAEKPKALAPILGRPFLAFLFDRLIDAGVQRAVICTGHMADQIRDEFKSQYRSLKVEYSQETQPLGTAGAIKLAQPLIGNSTSLVLNGDSVCDVDFRAFAAFHTAKKCPASMVLVEVSDASRFGRVDIAADDALLAYHEKSPEVRPGLINSGIYLLEPNVVESIPGGRTVSIERDIFPQWIGKGLYGFRCHGRFIDIGTPESYRQAEQFFGGEAMKPFVILDRDGTIIVEEFYLSDPAKVALCKNAGEGLRRMTELGCRLIVVSNQSGVGRGYYDEAAVHRVNARMNELLAPFGVKFDAIYYCPHAPDTDCECRKPKPGMLNKAMAEFGFDARTCVVIGDKVCDIELGKNVGAATILVQTGYGAQLSDSERRIAGYNVADLLAAADVIEQRVKSA